MSECAKPLQCFESVCVDGTLLFNRHRPSIYLYAGRASQLHALLTPPAAPLAVLLLTGALAAAAPLAAALPFSEGDVNLVAAFSFIILCRLPSSGLSSGPSPLQRLEIRFTPFAPGPALPALPRV